MCLHTQGCAVRWGMGKKVHYGYIRETRKKPSGGLENSWLKWVYFYLVSSSFCGLEPLVVVLCRNTFQVLPHYRSVWNVLSGAAGQVASLRIQLPGFRSTAQSLLLPWKHRASNTELTNSLQVIKQCITLVFPALLSSAAANRQRQFTFFLKLFILVPFLPPITKIFMWGKKPKPNLKIRAIVTLPVSNPPHPVVALLLFAQQLAAGRRHNGSWRCCNCRVLLQCATVPPGNENLLTQHVPRD